MKTMSDDICMIKEQFSENTFSEAASHNCSKIRKKVQFWDAVAKAKINDF